MECREKSSHFLNTTRKNEASWNAIQADLAAHKDRRDPWCRQQLYPCHAMALVGLGKELSVQWNMPHPKNRNQNAAID